MTYKTKKGQDVNIFYKFLIIFSKSINSGASGQLINMTALCRGSLYKAPDIFGYLFYVPPAQGRIQGHGKQFF